jgi:hypothetical protein
MFGQIKPKHVDAADGRRNETQQHMNGGGFPGTIRSKQSQYFTLFDVERNIVDSGEIVKPLGKVSDFDDGFSHGTGGSH